MDKLRNDCGELVIALLELLGEANENADALEARGLNRRQLERMIARGAHGLARNQHLREFAETIRTSGGDQSRDALLSAVEALDAAEKRIITLAREQLPTAPVAGGVLISD